MNENDFDKAVNEAIKELNISRKLAISELLLYICSHGTIEDFQNCINYFIKNQQVVSESGF